MDNKKTSKGFALVSLKTLKYVVIAVITIVCATSAYNFGSEIFSNETMEEAPGTDMSFTFTEGTSIGEVGETLEEYNVINSSTVFTVQSFIYSVRTVKPGTYLFNTSQTSEQIFQTISAGPEEEKHAEETETQK